MMNTLSICRSSIPYSSSSATREEPWCVSRYTVVRVSPPARILLATNCCCVVRTRRSTARRLVFIVYEEYAYGGQQASTSEHDEISYLVGESRKATTASAAAVEKQHERVGSLFLELYKMSSKFCFSSVAGSIYKPKSLLQHSKQHSSSSQQGIGACSVTPRQAITAITTPWSLR